MLVATLYVFVLVSSTLISAETTCEGLAEYSQCSTNKECGCLHHSGTLDNSGICGLLTFSCAKLNPCASNGHTCHDRNHVCVRHPICDFRPLCYPLDKATDKTCPSNNNPSTTTSRPRHSTSSVPIHQACDWVREGVTVLNDLKTPSGLFMGEGDESSVYVTDTGNHRIIKWSPDESIHGRFEYIGAGELLYPHDLVVSQIDGTIYICDKGNQRIVRQKKEATTSEILVANIECESLTMDSEGSLFASELRRGRVTRWRGIDEKHSTEVAVAGGNEEGSALNQLFQPRGIFFDEQERAMYVSDSGNHRVIKWTEGAKEGIVVAGGNGRGNGTHQLAFPRGIAIDSRGSLYIADTSNNRIVRWNKGAQSGVVIVDGVLSASRQEPAEPFDLVFDRNHRNLYVSDSANARLIRFTIDGSGSCTTLT